MILLSFKMCRERIDKMNIRDARVRAIFERHLQIFALKQISQDCQSLYESGYFRKGSTALLDRSYRAKLDELRPQMIAICESGPSYMKHIPSTIGNEYGDIYEQQFETARNSRMNSPIVPSLFETHMKPVMTMRKPQVPKL